SLRAEPFLATRFDYSVPNRNFRLPLVPRAKRQRGHTRASRAVTVQQQLLLAGEPALRQTSVVDKDEARSPVLHQKHWRSLLVVPDHSPHELLQLERRRRDGRSPQRDHPFRRYEL